jgi:hypothetical protein
MKKQLLLLTALLAMAVHCLADAEPVFVKRFRYVVQLIKADNARELSKWVRYPLQRSYPLPPVKNATEFIAYYPVLFDKPLKKLLAQYDDTDVMARNGSYGLVGGPFSGEIWMNDDGKITTVNYSSAQEQQNRQALIAKERQQMHPSVRNWEENVVYARSEKLLVRVDRTAGGLRYACWGKGKTMKDAPDIMLHNGTEDAQGTMGGWIWTWTNNGWTYVVDEADMCADPKDCGLYLELQYGGKTKSRTKLKSLR